jgi:hypothetical protein
LLFPISFFRFSLAISLSVCSVCWLAKVS